jgi:hypothetical protein
MKTKTLKPQKQSRTRASAPRTDFRSVSLADLDNIQGGACSHAGCSHNGEQQPGVNRPVGANALPAVNTLPRIPGIRTV